MVSVQELIRRDGVRQVITGSILISVMLFFVGSLFYIGFEGLLFNSIYSIAFGLAGIAVFRSGWEDLILANRSLGFIRDENEAAFEIFPERMYIGHKAASIFHACLYDMDGEVYTQIKQHRHFDMKMCRPFISFFSGGSLFPASYILKGEDGMAAYKIVKKGGFTWRGYVQRPDGPYLAYTTHDKPKGTGRSVFQYIEGNKKRWKAEGDAFIGHFEIKDDHDHLWAIIKRDAIPTEAAERFDHMPGYLVDWKKRKDVPHSLIAFLFLLQTNTSV
ncbi:hypothetical protein GCM10010954_33530 [Halobacillus andaensis]|uniref:Uncharacterized protein n=1 Tax=Halobacillus andaensis TaxID=1176239 RepID=A0A917BA41_HALAA|nr:hypothetical protein [Halobacillus andaensis]MBP2005458.1 hypothetical protein [Halobacillus andaensis]GGF31642.1 hypothetical protein GCM10010954_33530 [Halobacillus andaensis]